MRLLYCRPSACDAGSGLQQRSADATSRGSSSFLFRCHQRHSDHGKFARAQARGSGGHCFGEDALGGYDARADRYGEALPGEGQLQCADRAEGVERVDVAHV